MGRSDPGGKLPIPLKRNQQIDAICDRFELAWDAGSPPRIEEYLDLLPAADRRSLLGELLASEVALRGRHEVCNRAEYTERFPQYLDVVADVFGRHRPEPAKETADTAEQYVEIIQGFRSRRQSDASTTAIRGDDRNLRALAGWLSRHAVENPAEIDGPPEQQLWGAILRTCHRLNAFDPASLDAVVGSLLESFPPARQSLLLDVLLGHSPRQAARTGGVSQRTATSTILIATTLLAQAG